MFFIAAFSSSAADSKDDKVPALSMIIIQKYKDEYIYYLPNFNFISVKNSDKNAIWDENKLLDEFNSQVSKTALQDFKNRNDWGKPIDEKKCEVCKVSKNKKDSSKLVAEDRIDIIEKRIVEMNSGDKKGAFQYLTSDNYNRHIYYFRCMNGENKYGKAYFICFNPSEPEDVIEEIEDLFNYQEQLAEFKKGNNWNRPVS